MTHAQILAPMVEEIVKTYPYLPRGFMREDQVIAARTASIKGPDLRAWARFNILLESYAVLRVKGFLGAAAYLAVFRDGLMGEADRAATLALQIEALDLYAVAFIKEVSAMSLFGPEAHLEHLRNIDRMAATMRTEKGRQEAAKLRGKTLAAIKQQYQQPKE